MKTRQLVKKYAGTEKRGTKRRKLAEINLLKISGPLPMLLSP